MEVRSLVDLVHFPQPYLPLVVFDRSILLILFEHLLLFNSVAAADISH